MIINKPGNLIRESIHPVPEEGGVRSDRPIKLVFFAHISVYENRLYDKNNRNCELNGADVPARENHARRRRRAYYCRKSICKPGNISALIRREQRLTGRSQ
jgi:hypothetical protein